jgi:hypothetical protein
VGGLVSNPIQGKSAGAARSCATGVMHRVTILRHG